MPGNGSLTSNSGTTYGYVIKYGCDNGYNLVGMEERTCLATGLWNGTDPECEIVGE